MKLKNVLVIIIIAVMMLSACTTNLSGRAGETKDPESTDNEATDVVDPNAKPAPPRVEPADTPPTSETPPAEEEKPAETDEPTEAPKKPTVYDQENNDPIKNLDNPTLHTDENGNPLYIENEGNTYKWDGKNYVNPQGTAYVPGNTPTEGMNTVVDPSTSNQRFQNAKGHTDNEINDKIDKTFGNEADTMRRIISGESGFDCDAVNPDSGASGPYQILKSTYDDFMIRHKSGMTAAGATGNYNNDVKDPIIATGIAKEIRDEQGLGAWTAPHSPPYPRW